MSTRDVSNQSDISKLKTEEDGSFKRRPSSFRNHIVKGGQYEPDKGASLFTFASVDAEFLRQYLLGRYHLYVSYACRESSNGLAVVVL